MPKNIILLIIDDGSRYSIFTILRYPIIINKNKNKNILPNLKKLII